MPANPWPGDAASLLLLPSGPIGDELLEQALAWTHTGLLGPAIWLRPADVFASNSTRLSVMATVPTQLQAVEVDAVELLAMSEFKRVRLLSIRTLFAPGQDDIDVYQQDSEQLRAMLELHRTLKAVAPIYPGAGRQERAVRIDTINVVVAPPWSTRVEDESLVRWDWDWNVLLSLENRSTPFSTDALLRKEKGYVGAVLANVATVAGIWQGVPQSSLEMIERESSVNHGKLWLHRAFVRGVIKQGVISGVTAQAIAQAANPDLDLYDSVEGVIPADVVPVGYNAIDAYLDLLVEQVSQLQQSVLMYERPPGYVDVSKRKIGFFRQMVEFLSFTWDKLKLLPLLVARAIADAFNRYVNRIFQGKDGRSEVDVKEDLTPLKNDKRDMQLFSGLTQLAQQLQDYRITKLVKKKQVVVQTPPSAELWKSIRQLVFAALDGSPTPDGSSLPRMEAENKPVVLRRVSDVFFDPDAMWSMKSEYSDDLNLPEISWDNLELVDGNLDVLNARALELAASIAMKEQILALSGYNPVDADE